MRIFVSVGTHEQPFQRLLDTVARATGQRHDDEWIVQYGVGRWAPGGPRVEATEYLDAGAMQAALQRADVLVSQSSPGNVFGALAAGTWPLVLGRSRADGEHVDDHQIRFARALETMGYATDLVRPDRLSEVLDGESARGADERATLARRASAAAQDNQLRFRADVWTAVGVRS